ncbi:MAG: internalin [Myxococcaceae bacterium]|nr:internalin [Myxococcaceae bacterium]
MRLPILRRCVPGLLLASGLLAVQAPLPGLAWAVPTHERAQVASATGPGPQKSAAGAPRHGLPDAVGDVSVVRFAEGRGSSLPGSIRTLQAVQIMLAALPEAHVLRVAGHADDAGDGAFNLELSKRRARGVARWLIANGVEAERLELMACGRRYAVQGERTPTARAENRRVDLQVLPSAAGSQPAHERCDPIGLK